MGRLRCDSPTPTKDKEVASGTTKGRKGPPDLQGVRTVTSSPEVGLEEEEDVEDIVRKTVFMKFFLDRTITPALIRMQTCSSMIISL
ncbi:hypothetical protein Tco_1494467, partial [Tanacetum coccineum]